MNSLPPSNEQERLEALKRLDVLDTPTEPAFDRITALASRLLNMPISLVSLIDNDRQWFKSHHGLDICETPREVSFCAHALQQKSQILVAPDTMRDPRFRNNPFVTGEPFIRFYAGAPLVSREGQTLGTLCVLDTITRTLNDEECKTLEDLAAIVVDELELRLALHQPTEQSQSPSGAER